MITVRQVRKIKGQFMLVLSTAAAILGVVLLFTILYSVLKSGISGLSLSLFTEDYAPAGIEGGGMRQAFIGQIVLTFGASLIGIPIGIFGGIYLSEYGGRNFLGRFISSLADVSVSIPTIIIGTFIYTLLVIPLKDYNIWAGMAALAVIMIPVVMRTTEESLKLIPWTLREAALALGAPYYKVIKDIIIKSALTGIITGVFLAAARIAGETAPLLFTSFNNNFLNLSATGPVPSLTVTIYEYANSPFAGQVASAWAAALVVTVFILLSNIIIKFFIRKRSI